MGQTRREITQNLEERLCWQAAHRDDSRIARHLYARRWSMASTGSTTSRRQPSVDDVVRLAMVSCSMEGRSLYQSKPAAELGVRYI